MGKSIYILKIFLLKDLFPVTDNEMRKITRLVGFVLHLYGCFFLSASLSTAAPRIDLNFWYSLIQYQHIDPEIAASAKASMRRHLWYLTPELVVFGLFDDGLPNQEKQLMAVELRRKPRPLLFAPGKPGQPNFDPVAAHLTQVRPPLASFVTDRSWLLFSLLDANGDWLENDPSTWLNDPEYLHLQELIKDMEVVNDSAERAVKDVAEYAEMSRDPNHRDNVILVANDHRGRVAQMRKGDLNNI